MRIKKNSQPIKSSEMVEEVSMEFQSVSPYQCAIDNIYNAIECLGEAAKAEDSLAREAIANLSVVLLDLKSN